MEPPRETISLLITSILGGLALSNSIVQMQLASTVEGFSLISTSFMYFLVFVSVWLRFIPGNISHIRRLERWPNVPVNTWLFDISVITLESMIIVFMAAPSVNNPLVFFASLVFLLLLDVGWLAVILFGVRRGTRPEPQLTWLVLNIVSIAVLLVLSFVYRGDTDFLWLESTHNMVIITCLFVVSAIIDIYKSAPDWFGRPREVSEQDRKNYGVYMKEAIKEAKKSLSSNGIPIGAILVENGNIIGRGHNRRIQDGNPMSHAEIECLKNAGRRQSYKGTTLFSTLMPCCLCAGAIVQFGIKKVVVGEDRNFAGARSYMDVCGVKVIDLNMDECYEMLRDYIKANPTVWNEDIGK